MLNKWNAGILPANVAEGGVSELMVSTPNRCSCFALIAGKMPAFLASVISAGVYRNAYAACASSRIGSNYPPMKLIVREAGTK